MDAAYLQSTLGALLSEGVAATLLRSPPDPVEFLALWLRKSVAEKGQVAARQAVQEQQAVQDQSLAQQESKQEEEASRAESHKQASAAEREAQFVKLIASASSKEALLPAFLQGLRELVQASSAYLARFEPDSTASGEEGDPVLRYVAATADNAHLLDKRLTAAQAPVTSSLFTEAEEEEEEPEEEELDDDGNPKPRVVKEKPLKSVFVPNTLQGKYSNKLRFDRLPGPGCYLATRISFKGCVSDKALDEAVEREQELIELKAQQDEEAEQRAKEEAEEKRRAERGDDDEEEDQEDDEEDEDEDEEEDDDDPAARRRRAAKKKKKAESKSDDESEEESDEARDAREAAEEEARLKAEEEFILSNLSSRSLTQYALCLDTLNQPLGRRFSEEQLATIARFAKLLQDKLVELDRADFTAERKRRLALVNFQREILESNESGALRSEEERAEELERLSDELEAAGRPMTEEDVRYRYRTDLLLHPSLKEQIAAWADSAEGLPRGNGQQGLIILQAALFLLGYEKNQVVDASERADWTRMRAALLQADDFFARLRDYDPRATSHDSVPAERKYTESVSVTKLVGRGPSSDGADDAGAGSVNNIIYEEVKERNYALSELLLWVRDALEVKRRAKLERAKQKRDEEKKKAQEEAKRKKEEARAAKEAARAAAAAAAVDGEDEDAEERGEDEDEEEEED